MPPEIVYQIGGRRISFPLTQDVVTIGRSHENDLVIDRQFISRKHAKIYRDGDSWKVSDLGSKFGTRINDLRDANATLRDGDRIFLHEFALTFAETSRGAQLISRSEIADAGTVFKTAVDFSAIASSGPDVARLQRLLSIVTQVSEALLVSTSLGETFEKVLDLVFDHLPVERGFIMLWDQKRKDLITRCVRHSGTGSEIQFSRTIAEKVYREKVAVLTTDAQMDERFASGASIMELGIRSAMAAPLWKGDQVDGIIYVDSPLQTKAFDNFDLDLLSALGNHVAVAIAQWRLQNSVLEQKLARRRLERYHSPAVVERITSDSGSSGEALVADERDVTVLFADVVGFTKRCENMEPREVADLLNRYFSRMTEVIFAHEGTLDKFIGDCVMAVFGAPLAFDDHPRRAVEAALDMRDALAEVNEPLPVEARLQFRVGLHSGRVVAGDIGSVVRSDYTVLGSTVNLAARLEAHVAEPGQIVISAATMESLGQAYRTRCVGEHQPKGVSTGIRCYELLGRKEVRTRS